MSTTFKLGMNAKLYFGVAPFTGAWIETRATSRLKRR